jgi:hypothetical protein
VDAKLAPVNHTSFYDDKYLNDEQFYTIPILRKAKKYEHG